MDTCDMGVVGAMFIVTGLSVNMGKDSRLAKFAQSPPRGKFFANCTEVLLDS